MSSGVAMRCCAMSQAMLMMVATTRWATRPVLSRITETGTPSAARRPCAASRMAGDVAGRIEPLAHGERRRVLAQRRHDAQAAGSWHRPVVDVPAELANQVDDAPGELRTGQAQP